MLVLAPATGRPGGAVGGALGGRVYEVPIADLAASKIAALLRCHQIRFYTRVKEAY